MDPIVLKATAPDGDILQATFLPDFGMNMVSFKKGSIEVIDQSTKNIFDERFAGLGALIGPHFHRRKKAVLPKIADESLFPHIARVKAKGVDDPFSHGIARYAPWQAKVEGNSVKAVLTGKDLWNGVPLSTLEGQSFTMHFTATLEPGGLILDLDVVSDFDSLVGIHYYYHLPKGSGTVTSTVQEDYIDKGEKKSLKDQPLGNFENNQMTFDLTNEADYTFFPYPNSRTGTILLDTGVYKLQTKYTSPCSENSWQLYHPKDASFVSIEPISSQDPRHPNLTVSQIHIELQIL